MNANKKSRCEWNVSIKIANAKAQRLLRTMPAVIIFSFGSHAANAGVIGPYTVSTMEVTDAGIYFLVPAGTSAFPNPDGCQHPNWIAFDPSTPLADRAIGVGLSAQAQGKKVWFNIAGCLNGHIKAIMIRIDP